jgi:two-component system chemotaxis response regulator CheY
MRALIVDDIDFNQMVIVNFLKGIAECDVASNGKIAIELFRKSMQENKPYQCIFMDVMMPGLDGQDTLKAIRAIEKEFKVSPGEEVKAIMVTVLSDVKNVTKAFFHGLADAYLTKPVTRDKLLSTLKDIGVLTD